MVRKSIIWFFLLFFLVLTLACSFDESQGGEASSPKPTITKAEKTPTFTKTPAIPAKTPQVIKPDKETPPVKTATKEAPPSITKPPFEIEDKVYKSPYGAFMVNPPKYWSITEYQTGGTSWASPGGKAFLHIAFTNLGQELDQESYLKLIEAREVNVFGVYENYKQTSVDDKLSEGYYWAYKTLDYNNNQNYVATYYQIVEQALFTIDTWMPEREAKRYSAQFDSLLATVRMEELPVRDFPPYLWMYKFTDQRSLFEMLVPEAWSYSQSTGDNSYTDTFVAPNLHAIILSSVYDDGSQISKSDAGQIALELLRNYFTKGQGDIQITTDQVQKDGSERLDWHSKSGKYSGQSFFETRGTTFMMLTILVDDGHEYYWDVWDQTMKSYQGFK